MPTCTASWFLNNLYFNFHFGFFRPHRICGRPTDRAGRFRVDYGTGRRDRQGL
jgi:hypothetical protein